MKSLTVIRFVVAALFATLSCIGFLLGMTGLTVLWGVAWLLLMGHSELTKPIPRSERWSTLVGVGVLLAVFLTLPFLHLHSPSEPSQSVRIAVAVAIWSLWMWAIYRRWQREKGKTDA